MDREMEGSKTNRKKYQHNCKLGEDSRYRGLQYRPKGKGVRHRTG